LNSKYTPSRKCEPTLLTTAMPIMVTVCHMLTRINSAESLNICHILV